MNFPRRDMQRNHISPPAPRSSHHFPHIILSEVIVREADDIPVESLP
jgi:hypothetical protein